MRRGDRPEKQVCVGLTFGVSPATCWTGLCSGASGQGWDIVSKLKLPGVTQAEPQARQHQGLEAPWTGVYW